ncbi:MAG: ATP-dependent DNA ligase [Limisphaerales bacterium]|nr:MAG: ATP-dependent DNA ligase [Limisphaerales bacterium]
MTATMEECKSTSLYYREGSSDKEYHVRLEARDNGFVVNIAFGRRGSTLSTGTKMSAPVYYDAALMVFEKTVREKKAKGYTEGENGTPYQHSDKASQVSGLMPQLLNSIDEEEVARLVSNPSWCMQEKKDGRRLMLRKTGAVVEGINKLGLVVSVAEPIVQTARELKGDFIIDGEAIGDRLHAFDLLSRNGNDLRETLLFGSLQPRNISVVSCWTDSIDKANWLTTLKQQRAEGVVFKLWNAPYTSGRPNSGGAQLKYKFVATLSALVSKVNRQRSVGLSLLDQEGWQPVGNVTIPPNHSVPKVGAVVEIRYLYAVPDGSLYQPVYLGVRSDVEPHECGVSQLKFKRDEEDDQ